MPQALGNLQAFWILGFVATQFPVGWALDTLGPRRTVSLQMLAAVVGALLFATAHSALALNIAMLLIGAGCGSIYMGAIYLFGAHRGAAALRAAVLLAPRPRHGGQPAGRLAAGLGGTVDRLARRDDWAWRRRRRSRPSPCCC